ncbi:MAG: ABC transporter permease, partial [Chthonomonadales bacterium]
MVRYAVRRVLWAIPILIGVCLLTFLLFYTAVSPQQMARTHIGTKAPTDAQIATWLKVHGYDKPLSAQFKKHVSELLLFRFGVSDSTGESINDRLLQGVGPSALVASLVFVITLVIAILTALLLAWLRETAVDPLGVLVCIVLMSVPYVVVIMSGQFMFGKMLRWFPITGYQPGAGVFRFTILPAIIGSIGGIGSAIRFYRSVVLEELGQDYIRAARARGVPERRIMLIHCLRNASVPILTNAV